MSINLGIYGGTGNLLSRDREQNSIFGPGVHIGSPLVITKLEKTATIEKITLGPWEVEKIFVEILQTNYIFGVHMGSSS